ncbi:unnamed protein product [Lepidochelys olivacea]
MGKSSHRMAITVLSQAYVWEREGNGQSLGYTGWCSRMYTAPGSIKQQQKDKRSSATISKRKEEEKKHHLNIAAVLLLANFSSWPGIRLYLMLHGSKTKVSIYNSRKMKVIPWCVNEIYHCLSITYSI